MSKPVPATDTPGAGRRAAVALGILAVLGVILFVLSRRVGPPPSGTGAITGLVATLTEQQRVTSAGRVRSRCIGATAEPCDCVKVAVHEALDASLVEQARGFLATAKVCPEPLLGQEAELAVRSGAPDAEARATAALAKLPKDPYATYALAQLAWERGHRPDAQSLSGAAVEAGREAPAHLLIGLLALGSGDVEGARGAFTRALEREPADVAAIYDIALCDHRLGRYRLAREGYLSVLRKNPKHLDARYNLALLTNGAGFRDEAAHHLAELRKGAPGDPRAAQLEALLAATPPVPSAAAIPVPSAVPSPSALPAPGLRTRL